MIEVMIDCKQRRVQDAIAKKLRITMFRTVRTVKNYSFVNWIVFNAALARLDDRARWLRVGAHRMRPSADVCIVH